MTPEMSCHSCRDLLMEYAANVLSAGENRAVAAHLATCAECGRELDGWEAIAAAVRADEQKTPPDTSADTSWTAIRGRLASRPLLASGAVIEMSNMERDLSEWSDVSHARRTESHPPRRRPYVAVAACLLIVTLAVAVFGVIGTRGGSHRQSAGVSPTVAAASCSVSQLKAETPPYSSIRSISMVSPTDGWAVGSIWNWQGSTPPATLMMRFHNCAWEPFGQSIPSAWLTSVSMTSATDGWAVGATVDYLTDPANGPNSITTYQAREKQTFVLRFVQGQWQRVSNPVSDMTNVSVVRMVMTSANDGWMLLNGGKPRIDPYTPVFQETILHYTGGVWTVVPTPFETPQMLFSDLASVAPGECWIDGYDNKTGNAIVAHYQSGEWQTWNPARSGDNYAGLTSIGVTGTNDVWAASQTELYHYDGVAWKQVQVSSGPPAYHGLNLGRFITTPTTKGWLLHDTPGWQDEKGTGPLALHYDGVQWQWVSIPALDIGSLTDLAPLADTQAWAVGDGFDKTSAGNVARSKFVYYDNGVWTELPS